MKYRNRIIPILLVILGSCIDPLDVNIDREVNVLIVEGAITTQPGPHFVKLTRSAKYGSIFDGYVRPITGANVAIRDSDGKVVLLREIADSPGIYATSDSFKAVVGKSYTLLISTLQGLEYTSLPEKVIQAPQSLALSVEYKKTQVTEKEFRSGLDVLATFDDNPEARNYYMWKNNGTYKIKTYPEDYIGRDGEGNPVPQPKDCCEFCWLEEINGDPAIRLLSDNNVNGNRVTDVAAFIEDDAVRFYEKYLIRIEQHTLTREAYQFFSLLKEQLSINGDIFDPPPATLRGNMINLTNPDENVIGYFRVSDVVIDSLYLTKEMMAEPRPLRRINNDCRVYKNATTIKPSYW